MSKHMYTVNSFISKFTFKNLRLYQIKQMDLELYLKTST